MKLRIFITRNKDDVSSLMTLLRDAGLEVEAHSLIETVAIAFDVEIPASDWIFFSSATAVRHFFFQNPITGKRKFAAIGRGTAKELSKHVTVDFEGDHIDTLEIAKTFAIHIGNETVIFPGPITGLEKIQSVLPKQNTQTLICYRTLETPMHVGFPDVIIFSSPSNVRSYFQRNEIISHQFIIAYGRSTASALAEMGVEKTIIPDSLSDEDLLRAIKGISGS